VYSRRREIAILLSFAAAALIMPATAQVAMESATMPRADVNSAQRLKGVAARLEAIVASGRLDDLRWPNFSDYEPQLESFYGPSGYKPEWLRDGKPTAQAIELIQALQNADRKGLEPEDYDASRWAHRLTLLRGAHGGLEEARFDVALTICTMRYVSALQVGRINPEHLSFEFDAENRKLDLPDFVRQRLVAGSNLPSELTEVEPQFAAYRRLRTALQHYLELAERDTGERLPEATQVFPGQSYAGIVRLTNLLRLLGDLPDGAKTSSDRRIYDGALVDAVKRFQQRHALAPTGILDRNTIAEMNVPLVDRLDQMRMGLERYRWLPYSIEEPQIEINIPEFRLRCFEPGDRLALSMSVNVGEQYDFQTPLFEKELEYVVFRPYWYPPASILREAIIPQLRRNPSLDHVDLELIGAKGKVIRSGRVTPAMLQQVRSGRMTVRQQPGEGNAEGLIKFIFPNQYHVYIHDSPKVSSGGTERERVFTHGCIRAHEPAKLAAWVLRNTPGWDLKRVERAMHQGPNNVRVNLAFTIPVSIVYETAVVDESGGVHFVHDLYGNDAMLEGELAKGYPYSK